MVKKDFVQIGYLKLLFLKLVHIIGKEMLLYFIRKENLYLFSKYYDESIPDDIEATSVAFIEFLGEVKSKDPFFF